MTLTCSKCGGEVVRTSPRGRVPSYCSVGCRRAAEYECRRAQAALADVEDRARWDRINGRDDKAWQAERLQLEERLRVLLDDPADDAVRDRSASSIERKTP